MTISEHRTRVTAAVAQLQASVAELIHAHPSDYADREVIPAILGELVAAGIIPALELARPVFCSRVFEESRG